MRSNAGGGRWPTLDIRDRCGSRSVGKRRCLHAWGDPCVSASCDEERDDTEVDRWRWGGSRACHRSPIHKQWQEMSPSWIGGVNESVASEGPTQIHDELAYMY